METRSSKSRRLILISSYVSSRRPDVPARFESLNDDTLGLILEFVGNKSYRPFGALNKHCKEIYIASVMEKETFLYGYGPLSVITDRIKKGGRFDQQLHERVGKGIMYHNRLDLFHWALQEQDKYVLEGICRVAAKEGRIEILNEVWNNFEDDRRYIFGVVDGHAALCGQLNVLRWHETKCLTINNNRCAELAASNGHVHILQWLQEEQGLELFGDLHSRAIYGKHLHVLKWLREQGCPWDEYSFSSAARIGNLNVLQWLHDEGCPWDESPCFRVPEYRLKPEVAEWLRANGYSNKIIVLLDR